MKKGKHVFTHCVCTWFKSLFYKVLFCFSPWSSMMMRYHINRPISWIQIYWCYLLQWSMHLSITSLGIFCLTLNSSLIWTKCHIFVVVVVYSWTEFGLFFPFDNKWLIVTVDEPVAQEIWCRLLYESTNFSIANINIVNIPCIFFVLSWAGLYCMVYIIEV